MNNVPVTPISANIQGINTCQLELKQALTASDHDMPLAFCDHGMGENPAFSEKSVLGQMAWHMHARCLLSRDIERRERSTHAPGQRPATDAGVPGGL